LKEEAARLKAEAQVRALEKRMQELGGRQLINAIKLRNISWNPNRK